MLLPLSRFLFLVLFVPRQTWSGGVTETQSGGATLAFTPPRVSNPKDTTIRRFGSSIQNSPIPPPPPLSLPVWSLATPSLLDHDDDDSAQPSSTTSMNIVTFASAVSVAAPKYWMISLYHNTLTKDSFCKAQHGVLQLLTPAQKDVVPILGKRSGYDKEYCKQAACRDAGMAWIDKHELDLAADMDDRKEEKGNPLALLPHCASYLHVKLQSTIDAGDHLVTICELISTGVWDDDENTIKRRSDDDAPVPPMDQNNVLYTGLLRKEGII